MVLCPPLTGRMAGELKVRLGYRVGNLVGSVSKLKVKIGAGDAAQP